MKSFIKIVLIGVLIVNGLQAVKSVYAVSSFEQNNINKINEVLK